MPTIIYSPTGSIPVKEGKLAARAASLAGARIGVLDNSKANARLLLTAVAEVLSGENGAQVTLVAVKPTASRPCPPEIMDRLVREADVVITGTADCGSCTAHSVYDLVAFERQGIPCALLGTDSFEHLGRAVAETEGFHGLPLAVTGHPIGGLAPEVLRSRALLLAPAVIALLTAGA